MHTKFKKEGTALRDSNSGQLKSSDIRKPAFKREGHKVRLRQLSAVFAVAMISVASQGAEAALKSQQKSPGWNDSTLTASIKSPTSAKAAISPSPVAVNALKEARAKYAASKASNQELLIQKALEADVIALTAIVTRQPSQQKTMAAMEYASVLFNRGKHFSTFSVAAVKHAFKAGELSVHGFNPCKAISGWQCLLVSQATCFPLTAHAFHGDPIQFELLNKVPCSNPHLDTMQQTRERYCAPVNMGPCVKAR